MIKWTGSKRAQAEAIARLAPPFERYFEPFLGGGALLFVFASRGSIAADIYRPLVELWRLIQKDPAQVTDDYARQWRALRADSAFPSYYYRIRERFNRKHSPLDLNFLTRTCVNGIVRFNASGGFNNSFHLSRRGMAPARFRGVVEAWHQRIQGVKFVCRDYEATLEEARRGDFAYLDPPYAGNRQRYAESLDLERFLRVLERLNKRGVKWALSFDGGRGGKEYPRAIPRELYKRRLSLSGGNSAVNKVLNGPIEKVEEGLFLNYR